MAKNKVVTLALICIVLSVGLFGTLVMFFQQETDLQIKASQISKLENKKSTLQTQVENGMTERATLANQLSLLQADKLELETQIVSVQLEEDELNKQLDELEMEFVSLQTEKVNMETEVVVLQTEIGELNEDLLAMQTEIATLENEILQSYDLGYADGETEGYEVGYLQGIEDATEKGWYLIDPTYDEMDTFRKSDQTNQNSYVYPDYICYDFTADFIANAFEAGYRCGFVYIEFDESAHSIVCFNTTDQGLIYIEPQTDAIVTITIGEEYEGYIIEDVSIIW